MDNSVEKTEEALVGLRVTDPTQNTTVYLPFRGSGMPQGSPEGERRI